MDTLNALVPPKTQINALGSRVTIKPFNIRQTIRLIGFIKEVRQKLGSGFKSDNLATSDMVLEILGKLDRKQIASLVEILLNAEFTSTEKELAENISIEELSEILKALASVNDFKKIIANFTTAMELVNRKG